VSALALDARGLGCAFGALRAVDGVDLALAPGARHALIGPNGAGKTTFVNLLTGLIPVDAGYVRVAGHDVTRSRPRERVRRGLARTFQINRLFAALTVRESLLLAILERERRTGAWWRALAAERAAHDEARALAESLALAPVLDAVTHTLPYGQQRLLEVALALATRPRVLLLDEPAAGVPKSESGVILDALVRLPAEVAVLLIEHDMDLVFRFAQRITVLVGGRVLVEGPPGAIAADPRVRAVYLGEGHG
jgi:branched-chain amino acid transport system ATP-binding protein